MKLQNRIINYLVMFVIYYFTTFLLMSLDEHLEIHKVFIILVCGFTLINIFHSFLILKWTTLFNTLCSIIIAWLSLFLALKLADLHLFSKYDDYDVLTAIISNAVFSIMFWEIAYQTKVKMISNKKNKKL
jgi:predicted membrane channel-forming protein YqfA (hemolysin III family)